ncbi:MAG TPA: hypothetical protein VK689_00290, partial [Armatimonadota bacterium]|nr:hypothetical protein [Armatimonadota bacterium]
MLNLPRAFVRSPIVCCYGPGVVSGAVAIAAATPLRAIHPYAPEALLVAAAMLSAWCGGFGAGVLAMLLALAGAWFVLPSGPMPPPGDLGGWAGLALFPLLALLNVLLLGRLRAA